MENSILLKKSEEARLEQLFQSKSDAENKMRLSNFLDLVIERNMVSNKNRLELFYAIFTEAAGATAAAGGLGLGANYLNSGQFFYVIKLLAKALSSDLLNPVQTTFNQMLVDRVPDPGTSLGLRIPRGDEILYSLLSEECIELFILFSQPLRGLFTKFYHENINAGRKVISWKYIEKENLELNALCFLKFCRCSYLIPHLLNVETLRAMMLDTIPPTSAAEDNFYLKGKGKLIETYEKDKHFLTSGVQPSDDEPGLLYHEFILLLGRMALTCIKSSKTEEGKLKIFLTENLSLKITEENGHLISSDEYDLDAPFSEEDSGSMAESEEGGREEDIAILESKTMEKYYEEIDYEGILKELNILPQPPPELELEQYNIPGSLTFSSKRLYIGRKLPKADDGKKKEAAKKAAPKRAAAPRRGEAPPKVWKIAQEPPKPREPGYIDRFRTLMRRKTAPVFPTYSKWAHVNSKVGPCIIKEILYPPSTPTNANELGTLIESANVYHSNASYEMSIMTLEHARELWKGISNEGKLRPEVLLYFQMALGQCLESAGMVEAALANYITAKNMNPKMPHNHPDKALAYCGLGSVLFRMEEYVWSLRAYLLARDIREQYIGGDTVDAATIYNNLGCCMCSLKRNQEAQAYFKLAHAIFELLLGALHERTMTASQNIRKAKRMALEVKPHFYPQWESPWDDHFKKGGKGKKGKKGKKKKK